MNIGIVEDDKINAQDLMDVINKWLSANKYTNCKLIHYNSGEELLYNYKNKHLEFDIVFMDVMLSGISGLQTAEGLRNLGYSKGIVFTSNYTDCNYMQKSFYVNAINFYSKPVTLSDIDFCMCSLCKEKIHKYYFNSIMYSIAYSEIAFFESDRNYIIIHPAEVSLLHPKYKDNLSTIIKQTPKSFVQVHRSYIVNISYVTKIEGKIIFLKTNHGVFELIIGDNYLAKVLDALRYF